MNYLQQLHWRYATKRMQPEKFISKSTLNNILESIRLAPTSFGLQPYDILIVSDNEKKKALRSACMNQSQIIECQHLIVFSAWKTVPTSLIERYMQNIAKTRNLEVSSLKDYKKMLTESLPTASSDLLHWTKCQTYLALGVGLTACALEKIDSSPMEGFSSKQVGKILGIDSSTKEVSVLLAVGHRDEKKDFTLSNAKVRRPAEELFTHL